MVPSVVPVIKRELYAEKASAKPATDGVTFYELRVCRS
jgi:hypothetical protein